MKSKIQSLLNVNTGIVILLFFTFAFAAQLINTDFVNNDKVWYEYLEKQEEQKYNEYDKYLADFEEDLKAIDLPEADDAYDWDFFLLDSARVLIPFLTVCLGLAALIFVGFQFNDQLKHITFGTVFKSSIFAYLLFFIQDMARIIWFIGIKENYTYEDIQSFTKSFSFSMGHLTGDVKSDVWYQYILNDMSIELLLYLLCIPMFIWIATSIPYKRLLGQILIPFAGGFVLYQSIMTYIAI